MNCKGCGKEIFPPKRTWCSTECFKNYLKSPEEKYRWYEVNAKSRGYSFELTFKEFKRFWRVPCYYCGDKIRTIGLDRVDNSKGYSLNNVVPCCWKCNKFKFTGTVEEFITRCKRMAEKAETILAYLKVK